MVMLQPVQIAKRLVQADGYLELGMPEQALQRLADVENAGPFEALAQFLRGHALHTQQRYIDAATALSAAARLMPSPMNRRVWLQLSDCYRQAGYSDSAINSLARARGANLNQPEPPSIANDHSDEIS